LDNSKKLGDLIGSSKAIIFDFDNVIVDSEPFHYKAYADVFASKGHIIDRDEYWIEWTSKGGGAEGEIRRYNLDLDPNLIRKEKDPVYSTFCSDGTIPLFPLAGKIIDLLSRSGLRLAIASGSYSHDVKSLIIAHGIDRYFEAVVGKDDSGRIKPHPAPYTLAAKLLGLPAEDCLAIEDAEKGVISAHAAGMKVIVIDTELTGNLGIEGADLKLSGLEEMYNLLLESNLAGS
jgi:beta-phosphoglucomutase